MHARWEIRLSSPWHSSPRGGDAQQWLHQKLDLLTSDDVFSLSRPQVAWVGFPSRSELLTQPIVCQRIRGWHTSGQLYHRDKFFFFFW